MEQTFRKGLLTRPEIKEAARQRLRENRWPMVVAYLLFIVFSMVITGFSFGIISLLVLPVAQVALSRYWVLCWRGEQPATERILEGCTANYGRKLGGMLLMYLKIWLWCLLFFIPGIVKSYAYAMTPYLLALYPNIKPTEATRISDRITKGHKGDLFVSDLSFLGWGILSAFTFGILDILFVSPYMSTTMAGWFDELTQNALQEGRITQSMLDGEEPVV